MTVRKILSALALSFGIASAVVPLAILPVSALKGADAHTVYVPPPNGDYAMMPRAERVPDEAPALAFVPSTKVGAYTSTDGVNWTPLANGASSGFLAGVPNPVALYCLPNGATSWSPCTGTGGGGGGGTGTVTSFSATNPGTNPFFTTAVTTPSTTPQLAFTITQQAAGCFFAGPASGPNALPTCRAIVPGDVPTLNQNTTGSAWGGVVPPGAGGTGNSSANYFTGLRRANSNSNDTQAAAGTDFQAPISGDCTSTTGGAVTCTKTSGTAFGTAATRNVGAAAGNVPFLNASALIDPAVLCTGTVTGYCDGATRTWLVPPAINSANIISALGYTPSPTIPIPGTTATNLALYRFSEASGSTLMDYSGNGNNGTITGPAPTFLGNGYQLDNQATIITLPTAVNAVNSYYFVVDMPTCLAGGCGHNGLGGVFFGSSTNGSGSSSTTGVSLGNAAYYYSASENSGVNGAATYGLQALNATFQTVWGAPTESITGKHILGFTCTTGVPGGQWYLDGFPLANHTTTNITNRGASCFNANNTTGRVLYIGAQFNSVWMRFHLALLRSTSDTADTVQSVTAALKQAALNQGVNFTPFSFNSKTAYDINAGDSITCGYKMVGCTGGTAGGAQVYSLNSPTQSNAYASTLSYPAKVAALLTGNTYTAINYGLPNAYVEQQQIAAPVLYAPLCQTYGGSSFASLMEGTNNFSNTSTDLYQTPAQIAQKNFSWASVLATYGCRPILMSGIGRTGNAADGTTYDSKMQALGAVLRAGWKTSKYVGFVDLFSDPGFGTTGITGTSNANAGTYFAQTANFTAWDGVHPNELGTTELATAKACVENGIDGSSAANMNPVPLTATSTTLTCADGGRLLNPSANAVAVTLVSAMWQTGRQIQFCNIQSSATFAATLTAPSDFPFNNVSGSTSITVPQNGCVKLEATFNQTPTAPGNYWRITQ